MHNLIWKGFGIEQGHVWPKDRERESMSLRPYSYAVPNRHDLREERNGWVAKRMNLEKVDDLDHIAIQNFKKKN